MSNKNEIEQLIELSKENMLTSTNLNRQMGVLNTAVKLLENRQDDTDKEIKNMKGKIQGLEDDTSITGSQRKQIRQAIAIRTSKLLELRYDKTGKVAPESIGDNVRYRKGFISRCYNDCKTNSRMADSYVDTAKRDFDAVMEFIQDWIPPGGVESYKDYLDQIQEEKAKMAG